MNTEPNILQQAIIHLETTLRSKPPVKVSLAPAPSTINWCNSDLK